MLLLLGVVAAVILTAERTRRSRHAAFVRRALGGSLADEVVAAAFRALLMSGAVVGLAVVLVAALAPLFGAASSRLGAATPVRFSVAPEAVLGVLAVLGVAKFLTVPMLGAGARDRTFATAWIGIAVAGATVVGSATAVLASGALRVMSGDGVYPGRNLVHMTVDFGRGVVMAPPGETLQRLVARLALIPKVESVSFVDRLPEMAGSSFLDGADIDGNANSRVVVHAVHHELFRALGLEVTHGRGLLPSDGPPAEPVALADAALARRLSGDPLGAVIRSESEYHRIVGVVPETRSRGPAPFAVEGAMFVPYGGSRHFTPPVTEVVARLRETPAPESLLALRNAALTVSPALRVLKVETAALRRASQLGADAIATLAIVVFGISGLLLAVGSVVGQVHGDLRRRGREFAIRQAVGAAPIRIHWEAARPVLLAAGVGAAFGVLLSWLGLPVLGAHFLWLEEPSAYLVLLAGAVVALSAGLAAWPPRPPRRLVIR